MSLGEDRVRVKFNPSATGLVDQIKQKTAELIDLCNGMNMDENGAAIGIPWETARAIESAMMKYEEAAMWAVKAATAPPRTSKRPTVQELETILNSDDQRPVHIRPDGSISVL